MRHLASAMVISVALLWQASAVAFDACEDFLGDPGELRQFVIDNGVHDAPMRYFEQARSIRVETEAADRLIPVARSAADGHPVIVYPAAFPPMLCRMALATYLDLEAEDWRPFAIAARDAASCIATGPRDPCLLRYAEQLEQSYGAAFRELPEREQRLAFSLATDAVGQVAKHEYAHHLLRHAERIRSGALERIDAEFEADFYAVQNGAQGGEAPAAMYYFFKPLADMEAYAESPPSPDYESGLCRAVNVDDITGLFGIAPIALRQAVWGNEEAARDLQAIAEELTGMEPPGPDAQSCGRLTAQVLRESHAELTRLVSLVAPYAALLPAAAADDAPAGGLGLGAEGVMPLVEDLQGALGSLVHLKGLAAGTLSILVRRLAYGGVEAEISAQLDRAIDAVADDILAGDYGRLLQVRALQAFRGEPDPPLEARMEEARPLFEATVTLLPRASESWMNLAFIALLEGDCEAAARFAEESARVAGGDRIPAQARLFRDDMRETSAAGLCAESSARFAAGFK